MMNQWCPQVYVLQDSKKIPGHFKSYIFLLFIYIYYYIPMNLAIVSLLLVLSLQGGNVDY